MKTKLIVIAGILCLPLSVAFADMKNNSTTEPTNIDGTTTSEPMERTIIHPLVLIAMINLISIVQMIRGIVWIKRVHMI